MPPLKYKAGDIVPAGRIISRVAPGRFSIECLKCGNVRITTATSGACAVCHASRPMKYAVGNIIDGRVIYDVERTKSGTKVLIPCPQCGIPSWKYTHAIYRVCRACKGKASSIDPELRMLNAKHNQYTYSATTRGLKWELPRHIFDKLIMSNCEYCEAPPPGGIDRIDSGLGYIENNVVPCCTMCNFAKGSASAETWNEWRARIARKHLGRVI